MVSSFKFMHISKFRIDISIIVFFSATFYLSPLHQEATDSLNEFIFIRLCCEYRLPSKPSSDFQ